MDDKLDKNSDALVDLRQDFESGETQQLRDKFESRFRDFYEGQRYEERSALPLISRQDKSVLYTGATISAIKDVLMNEEYPEGMSGVYVAQECLRTNAQKYLFNNEWIPYGQMYFHMASILSRPGRMQDVIQEAVTFTRDIIGIESDRIKIRTTAQLGNISNIGDENILIEYDAKPSSYYEWVYGIEGIRGVGATVAVLNPVTNKWFDAGNIISIIDLNGKEIGIEFGYGYEFFLTAAIGIDQPLKLSRAFEVFPFELGMAQKYYSTLEATVMMRLAGAFPKAGQGSVHGVYMKHLCGIQHMARQLAKTTSDVIDDMRIFMQYVRKEEIETDLLSPDLAYMNKHENYRGEFKNMVKRVIDHAKAQNSGKPPKQVIKDPNSMLIDYIRNRGLDFAEVQDELKQLGEVGIIIES